MTGRAVGAARVEVLTWLPAAVEPGVWRADLDGSRKRAVSDQSVRARKREPVHCTARRQAETLGTDPAAVLHGTGGTDRRYHQLAHAVINSATISPASAARSCSAKVLASTMENVT